MQEYLNDAKEELKRLDHSIYVSLKYTRTVDVFMNIISSMVDAYDCMLDAVLEFAREKNLIIDIPSSPREKGELIKETFDDEVIRDNVNLYFLLRKLSKSVPERANEYRRNVTMTAYIDNRKEIVNIDIATEYYHFQREFLDYIHSLIVNSTDNSD